MYYHLLLKEFKKILDNRYSKFDYIIFVFNENLPLDKVDLINADIINQDSKYRISTLQTLSFVINSLKGNYINLKVGQRLQMEKFIELLEKMGYRRSFDPLEKLSYQVRGNIIDVNFEISVRIEIEDDLVHSIRIFNPDTLLSTKKIESVSIPFIKPLGFENFENFQNLQILVVTSEPDLVKNVLSRKIPHYVNLSWEFLDLNLLPPVNIEKVDSVLDLIPLLKDESYKIIFDTSITYQKFVNFLINYCKKKRHRFEDFDKSICGILEQKSHFGYIDEEKKIIFLTSEEFENDYELELQKSNIFESINEFKEGDLVVVEGYGIGIYLGTKKIKVSYLEEKEFVQIQFKKNRKMSFAIEYVNLHKYISSHKISEKIRERILSVPSLKSWQKKIEKVYTAVKSIGDKILEINSKRYSTIAYHLKPNILDYLPEETCNFVLTKDQERVAKEVLEDLSRPFPSNRLILADTGYGKTEILIRAINRCLSNGYKSILFVPTTILA
ncbi:MAG: CarD family transcriptional regulator, partial [bacterium]